ncbi:MAG: TonB-dependent receptor [Xanthomonadaceae bacterium]|nr:TonB-dependent receptor [Xanthomonadaceae bacterium]
MTTIKQLPNAIRFALLVGAVSTASVGNAIAQDQDQDSAALLDRVEVTGSRIRQVELETAQPVFVLTREAIENQGFQSVADLLQNLAVTGSPPLSRASPLSAGEAAGGSFVSMRNLGPTRTLVLVNGVRLGITTGGLADTSTIPLAAVERIEVLKDGASSIYGSDAIAGVVNIITRSNFNGATASVYAGQFSPYNDGDIERYDLLVGSSGDRYSVTMAVEYGKEAEVGATDRPFTAFPQSDLFPDIGWTTVGQFGGFVTNNAAGRGVPGVPNGTRVILREGGDPTNPADYRAQNTSQLSPLDKSNTLEQTTLRSGIERRAINVNGLFQLTDSIRARAEATYNHRDTTSEVAGFPLQGAVINAPLAADSYFNPFADSATPTAIPNWWRRGWEVPRTSERSLTTYRFSGGLDGSFEIGDRYFDWDANYMFQDNRTLQEGFGDFNLANVRAAVGPSFFNTASGRVECGTAAAPIAFGSGQNSCVPWNPLLPFGAEGQGSLADPLLQQFLFQTIRNTGTTTTQVVSLNFSGLLFTLPAGDLGFAVGAERRKEKGKFVPDALAVTGGSSTLASLPTEGGFDVNEVYGELAIPLLADVAFAQELSLNLSSRHSDFDTFGTTTNSKAGLTWRPLDELLIRGTWAQGFRAPTISNLFAGGSQTFSFFTDPCDTVFGQSTPGSAVRAACAADGRIPNPDTFRQLAQGFNPSTTANAQTPLAFFSGAANPNLEPEESISKTVGFVWSPSWVEGLTIGVDWWNIHIGNTIVGDSPNQILNDCFVDRIQARCSSAIFTRDPALGGIVNFMQFGNRNAGFRETEGWDFDFQYRRATENLGDFAFSWQTTYTSFDEFKSTDDPDALSQPQVSFGSNFRIRSTGQINWSMGDFGINWGLRYFSAWKETCFSVAIAPELCSNPGKITRNGTVTNENRVGSTTYNDAQLRWSAPWNATIAVGANNVFNRIAPPAFSQPNANVPFQGEFDIGRFIYARYTQSF